MTINLEVKATSKEMIKAFKGSVLNIRHYQLNEFDTNYFDIELRVQDGFIIAEKLTDLEIYNT